MIADAERLVELPTTKHRDYILTPYEPCCAPEGRLHSASLLKYLMRVNSLDAWPIVE